MLLWTTAIIALLVGHVSSFAHVRQRATAFGRLWLTQTEKTRTILSSSSHSSWDIVDEDGVAFMDFDFDDDDDDDENDEFFEMEDLDLMFDEQDDDDDDDIIDVAAKEDREEEDTLLHAPVTEDTPMVEEDTIMDDSQDSLIMEPFMDQEEHDEEVAHPPSSPMDGFERAWRHIKKPLLRVGKHGTATSHGNSLWELLQAHTLVKVKINTNKMGTLEEAFVELKDLAEQAGASEGIELVQYRNIEKTILFGMPGVSTRIQAGVYPPPPPKEHVLTREQAESRERRRKIKLHKEKKRRWLLARKQKKHVKMRLARKAETRRNNNKQKSSKNSKSKKQRSNSNKRVVSHHP